MPDAVAVDEASAPGLRARKKAKTASAIERIGIELFLNKGFEQTTIDEIVERAEISRRTFFRYYRSKEDVLFAIARVRPMTLFNSVLDQPPGTLDRDCIRIAMRDVVVWLDVNKAISYRIFDLIEENQSLHARSMQVTDEYAAELAMGLVERHRHEPDGPSQFECRLLSQVGVATCRVAMRQWWLEGGRRPIVEYLDEAFAVLVKHSRRTRR